LLIATEAHSLYLAVGERLSGEEEEVRQVGWDVEADIKRLRGMQDFGFRNWDIPR
jgi:hypothetical protein